MRYTPIIALAVALFLVSCGGNNDKPLPPAKNYADVAAEKAIDEKAGKMARAMFGALPAVAENPDNPITEAKVKLGQMLYFDKRLSLNNTQSCNTCHDLGTFGVDNKPLSEGDLGKTGDRNSPTTLNAAFHATQFWDGRAKTVEQQAGMPITNPVEMNIPNEAFLEDRLGGIDMYKKMFSEAFGEEGVTYDKIELAIAAFERKLVTPSKFDDYMNGDDSALNLQEKRGMQAFMDVGCNTCHMGNLLGGNIFQKFGVYGSYWEYTKSERIDEGRFKETGVEGDKYMFKVPSMRNVTKTGPYFHDGSVADLGEAIQIMAKVELNKDLTEDQVGDMIAFLDALTGELPADLKTIPAELADQ